jgi:hypothetical protein
LQNLEKLNSLNRHNYLVISGASRQDAEPSAVLFQGPASYTIVDMAERAMETLKE